MKDLNRTLKFFISMAKVQAGLSRRFDRGVGGLGFSEFIILYHLNQAEGEKLSRTELAGKVGLTQSGVTRLLLPMEKIGMVKREANERDARVSLVALAPGGKRLFTESVERMELLADEVLPSADEKKLESFSIFLSDLAKNIK